jgi:hypothetical protein
LVDLPITDKNGALNRISKQIANRCPKQRA